MADSTPVAQPWPPSRMAVFVGAVVLQGERALFVRQAAGHSLAGQWSIPWGLVDEGEWPAAAVLRETREEAGITAELVGLLGLQDLTTEGSLGIAFLCRHLAGEPTPDGGVETDAATYLSLVEMAAWPEPFEPWSAWLVGRVLRGEHHLTPPEPDNPFQPQRAFL